MFKFVPIAPSFYHPKNQEQTEAEIDRLFRPFIDLIMGRLPIKLPPVPDQQAMNEIDRDFKTGNISKHFQCNFEHRTITPLTNGAQYVAMVYDALFEAR